MRSKLLHVLAGLCLIPIAGAAVAQECQVDACTNATAKARIQAIRAALAASAPVTCKGTGNPGPGQHDCKEIPVTVIELSPNSCVAYLPYSSLTVKGSRGSKVTWDLFAPPGYAFAASGVAVSRRPAGQPEAPSDYWEKDPQGSSARKHTLRLKRSDPARFCHVVNVVNASGDACCPADPIIANEN
jgi:hypothetical protein